MPRNREWATLEGDCQYIPTKPEQVGRSASPVSWSNLLLPGNCNNCSKSTACCGLVSGPQGKNICCCYIPLLSHCTVAVEQYENQLLCAQRHSYPCGTGQWCQPYFSTGFERRQAAHSNMMRRQPSITGPAPTECLLCKQPPGSRSWVREEQGAGTLLQCYRAAEAFHI